MGVYNELGYAAFSFLALAVAYGAGGRLAPWVAPRLLLIAVLLRIVGSTARYEVLWRFYDGVGDAVGYYWGGRHVVGAVLARPLILFTPAFWAGDGNWWGTSFLQKVAGFALLFTGPSMRAGFLAFSLLAFGGLFAIAKAFRNVQPGPDAQRFAAWLWLWPSLWFWPSSLGKEAVILLGIGLACLGYTGPNGKAVNWPLLLAGIGLTFCVRPHVALVLALATMVAHWLGTWGRLSLRRVAEALVAIALTGVAFVGMRAQFGLEHADFEGMREFVEYRSEQTLTGGSNIGSVPLGFQGVPLAFVNVWMRPFLWEAHNATAAFAALEIAAFWLLVLHRRRAVWWSLRNWRSHRVLRFSLPFLVLYTLMIGIAFGNLGIIARQRAPIFPFMLMLLAAAPAVTRVRATAHRGVEGAGPPRAATPVPGAATATAHSGAEPPSGEQGPEPAEVKIRWMPAPSGEPPPEAT